MNIYEKLMKARTEIRAIVKDSSSFTGKYASLPNVILSIEKKLNEAGLVVVIPSWSYSGKDIVINTDTEKPNKAEILIKKEIYSSMIYDVRAELVDTEMPENKIVFNISIPHDNTQSNLTHGWGSATTYGRRYIYFMIFDLPIVENDSELNKHELRAKTTQKNGNYITKAQKIELWKVAQGKDYTADGYKLWLESKGYTSSETIPNKDYSKLLEELKNEV